MIYPRYHTTHEARCFNCCGVLEGIKRSNYAKLAGEWQGWCFVCRYFTWFDLIERKVDEHEQK